jgi:hypothetical protein
LGTALGFTVLVPAQAWALPPGCTQTGENFVCTAGLAAGQTLTGTANANIITITGGPVSGTVNALGGNDTITVTGTAGANGGNGRSTLTSTDPTTDSGICEPEGSPSAHGQDDTR